MKRGFRTISDKALLAAYGLISMAFIDGSPVFVLFFFIALGLAYISEIIKKRVLVGVAVTAYIAAAPFLPVAAAFLPLVTYEPCRRRLWGVLPCAALFGYIAYSGAGLERADAIASVTAAVIGCGFAAVLAVRGSELEKRENEVMEIRDVSAERRMDLEKANKELQSAQDSEIYAATMAERNRIAREIHDNVGHVLSRAILMTGAISTMNSEEALKQPLADLERSLSAAMDQVRASVHDLHDDSVDLEEAAEMLVRDFGFCDITLNYDVSGHVPKEVKYCILTVLKEALANIIKHSDATHVDVTVHEHPAIYQLTVADNGTLDRKAKMQDGAEGISEEMSGGIGIINMRERALGLGGSFSISTDDGFRIFMTLPKGK